MFNYTPLVDQSRNGDSRSIVEYLFATEELTSYYTGVKDDASQRWFGKGHKALGLRGEGVTEEVMKKLCQGFAPDGTKLVRNAGQKPREKVVTDPDGTQRTVMVGGRRIGTDLTFSPPKDVSIAFAVAPTAHERGLYMNCQRRAVAKVMGEIEDRVQTRLGAGGREHHRVSGLLASMHDHLCNRDIEPDIHTHVLLYNMALCEDGKWRTFDTEEILRFRMSLDAVYQSELYANLKEEGLVIDQVMEEDEWGSVKRGRIRGVSDELIKAFSQRRKAILAYANEHGVSKQTAAMATRKHKDEPSFVEMKNLWEEVVEGLDPALLRKSLIENADRLTPEVILPKRSIDELAEALHNRDAGKLKKASQKHETGAGEALATEKDMWLLLAREHMGEVRLEDLKQLTSSFIAKAGLEQKDTLAIAEEDRSKHLARKHTEARYQTKGYADKERYIVERAVLSTTEDLLKLPESALVEAIAEYEGRKGFKLTDEQRDTLKYVTSNSGGIAVIQGYAGTGKTTVAEVYKNAFEGEGYTLRGVAVSSKAAMKLQEESKMPCDSMTSTLMKLEKGELKLTDRHVVVVDEAGMVGATHMSAIMHHCEKAGAKLVVQGDDNQLAAVQAGNALTLLKDTIGASVLKDIRRQSRVEDRETALKYYQKTDTVRSKREQREIGQDIFDDYQKKGYLNPYNNLEEAKQGLARACLADPRPMDEKIILTHTRDDARSLNLTIRGELKARGVVAKHDFEMKCYHNKKFVDREFSTGDQIRFMARDNGMGVVNNTEGTILGIKTNRAGSLDLTVQTETGRKVIFDTALYNAIDHNYAVTIHKSQGQTKDSVYHLLNIGMTDAQSALVAFTRMRENYKIFGTTADIESLAGRMGRDRKKENALRHDSNELKAVKELAAERIQTQATTKLGKSYQMSP